MTELSGKVRLRPTRIGFLVRPTDRKSVRKIMRVNACLWGGQYNPIIPVFRNTPKDWRNSNSSHFSGKEISSGYVSFFNPDVFVEAEEGLLEKSGLGELRGEYFDENVIQLDEFFEQEYRGLFDPYFGQSVFDVIDDTYFKERRFKLRDPHPAFYSKKNDVMAEICLGVYPEQDNYKHVKKAYHDVYLPESKVFDPETWLKVYNKECVTPFSVSKKHIEIQKSWNDEPIIYLFDPLKTTDLIDLWNMRIQPSSVYPVPIKWASDLFKPLCGFIKNNFRPLKNNPSGLMHNTTIEISRSISEKFAKKELLPFFKEVPKGSVTYKFWRTPIWDINYKNHFVVQPERARLSTSEKDVTFSLDSNENNHAKFETLSPKFAERYSGSKKRWANILNLYNYIENNIASCLPYNGVGTNWLYNNDPFGFIINREGWVFLQDYKDQKQHLNLPLQDELFLKWFKSQGLKVSPSEAGQIAKQMIESLGGIYGLHLFSNKKSIQFVNNLANSTRKRGTEGNIIEEDFSGKVASISTWQKMISEVKSHYRFSNLSLSNYIEKNVAKIGLETKCTHCYANNWHDLDEVSYQVKCTRCLKQYKFPQGNLKKNNQNWKFRVIGPFAIPDYAQGAYASLLTVRFFNEFNHSHNKSSYITATEIVKNSKKYEIDFAIWRSDESGIDINPEPDLIIGEAKSFASDSIKDKDLEHLKEVASLLPNSVLVISVLKEDFSDDEKDRLNKFIEWSRESKQYEPKHWVILLTGTELFGWNLNASWRDKGSPHSDYTDYQWTRNVQALSNATLAIYLERESYFEWRERKNKNNS